MSGRLPFPVFYTGPSSLFLVKLLKWYKCVRTLCEHRARLVNITQSLQTSVSVPGLLNTRQPYIIHSSAAAYDGVWCSLVWRLAVLSVPPPPEEKWGNEGGLLLRFSARLSLTELSCLT